MQAPLAHALALALAAVAATQVTAAQYPPCYYPGQPSPLLNLITAPYAPRYPAPAPPPPPPPPPQPCSRPSFPGIPTVTGLIVYTPVRQIGPATVVPTPPAVLVSPEKMAATSLLPPPPVSPPSHIMTIPSKTEAGPTITYKVEETKFNSVVAPPAPSPTPTPFYYTPQPPLYASCPAAVFYPATSPLTYTPPTTVTYGYVPTPSTPPTPANFVPLAPAAPVAAAAASAAAVSSAAPVAAASADAAASTVKDSVASYNLLSASTPEVLPSSSLEAESKDCSVPSPPVIV